VAEGARFVRWRRLVCVAGSLAAPIAGVALSVVRFYATPIIFAFDPFFGYFSGALYDTIVDVRTELWTYRAGTAATIVAAALLAAASTRDARGRLRLRLGQGRAVACLLLGIACGSVSLGIAWSAPRLGHWQTASTIAQALGGRAAGPRCDVVYPEGLLPDEVALLVRDCEEELAAGESRLGAKLGARLTEFVFSDAGQKRALMGAADTSIAKPWRHEVYVQLARYPHPVLGHEIAHVVAGSFAPGPFHVGGGLWPNPGLIEGIAVATAPDDDELTDAQWARAMLDLGVLPSMRDLFSLDFLGQSAAKSYTAAGAFVAWAIDTWGTSAVRAWYGGGSIEALTGKSWDAIDRAFRQWLETQPMPPEAAAYARARFDRPSVWGRRCPHVVDALNRDADGCRDERRFARALALYARALQVDPSDRHARFERAHVDLRNGDAARGRAALEAMSDDPGMPRTTRDRAEETLGDDDLSRGHFDAAAAAYKDVASRTLDEDAARTLDVKAFAARNPDARTAITDLLVGGPARPVDPWIGALTLGTWLGRSDDPLAAYLAGKNLAQHGDWARAAAWLDRANDLDLARGGAEREAPSELRLGRRVRRELLRERAVTACATNDADALDRVARAIKGPDSPFAGGSGGRRDGVLRLLARCRQVPAAR
jgi:tetratricopeptide (TPR) repeat protein